MIKNLKILNFVFIFLFIILSNNSYSDVVNKITIKGNKRISFETIKMFSNVKLNDNINVEDLDSTTLEEAVEVYVGGTRVTTGYVIAATNPVRVEFSTAPADGSEVTILVRRGVTWYQGTGLEPSDGVALQDTNTQAARFLRGF